MSHTPAGSGAILVTGTSSGIGLQSAITLSRAGYAVVATVRRPESVEAVLALADQAQVALDVRRLDVTSDRSVAECVDAVLEEHGAIHALVNNAGAGHLGTFEQDTMAEIRATCELNFFGAVRVSKAVLPHLRASRGRLITVTSVGGVVGQPFNDAYCAAKFAVEGLMESFAPVARTFGVSVSVIEPGAVATEFAANVDAANARPGTDRALLENYLRTVGRSFTDAQPAIEVADVVLEVLCAPEPAFRYQTSPQARRFAAVKLADVTGAAVRELTSAWLLPG
jgi:NAD(P)-dependent dehydrogenase (short-subunit alcohol dehydrogenase family)